MLRTIFWLVFLFVLHTLFIYYINQTSVATFQAKYLYWNYTHQIVFFVLLPVLLILLLKRRPSDYGLFVNRNGLVAIGAILGLTVLLPMVVDFLQGAFQWKKATAVYLVSTLIYQLIFSGCGEELYFRGIYQGEINRVSKRKWKLLGQQCGPGFLIAALFFGVAHLGIVEWIASGSSLKLYAFFMTFGIGCLLGLAREAIGSIWVVGILHGGIDTYHYLANPSPLGRVVHFVGLGVVFWLIYDGRMDAVRQIETPAEV